MHWRDYIVMSIPFVLTLFLVGVVMFLTWDYQPMILRKDLNALSLRVDRLERGP